ncbi:MAG: sodium-dependent bicarbonate transport family permease [Candidatus Fonsibacter ubiquis]|nr:sodium-dependent bicarbonate transport family permease [Candidatus Fonsibacter ubiquis]NCX36284.1 sodium-dependent bicarbonate transport family permease [Actinomycetota bacterium]
MQNILDPAILFFIFGVFAGAVRSNLEIPPAITKFLSLYLLMALGLKGGFALQKSGLTIDIAKTLSIAVLLAIIVPILGYFFLRKKLNNYDAAAIAATYGSVSAVTFITASQFLDLNQISYGGHMAAAMALMESPAIILAVFLANAAKSNKKGSSLNLLHKSFTDGAQLLLIGAMIVGLFAGSTGERIMAPFSIDLFKGMLAFFLLDMGLMVAKNFKQVLNKPIYVLVYGIFAPPVHALLALIICKIAGVGLGETILLMVLSASASYIAVPAALKYALPQANPSLYFGMSLGLTFPINIIIGIPLYTFIAKLFF